jgi:hypothetical protein
MARAFKTMEAFSGVRVHAGKSQDSLEDTTGFY